jgi:hypothetical protein
LIDENGSFLLLDSDGNPSLLVVKSANIAEHYSAIAKDNYASPAIKTALTNREKIAAYKHYLQTLTT